MVGFGPGASVDVRPALTDAFSVVLRDESERYVLEPNQRAFVLLT